MVKKLLIPMLALLVKPVFCFNLLAQGKLSLAFNILLLLALLAFVFYLIKRGKDNEDD